MCIRDRDLINPSVPIELKDDDFKIYTRNYAKPPSFVSRSAAIENSIVGEGCDVRGTVENSVIFTGCKIEEGAVIKDLSLIHIFCRTRLN